MVQCSQRCAKIGRLPTRPDLRLCLQTTAVKSALETRVLPKLRSLESVMRPINRLPKDIFILIPRFFTADFAKFPMNGPLITMTHVCRSWRNVLLSTPSLWTQLDFSTPKSKEAVRFLGRSGNQLLNIFQLLESEDNVEPFLSTTLRNIYRLRRLEIDSYLPYPEPVLTRFTRSAPELRHLEITNNSHRTDRDAELHDTIFEGHLPKLTSLSLCAFRTNLRAFNFPSLRRFEFTTQTNMSIQDLTSFFRRCPSLEYIEIFLSYITQPPIVTPHERVRLAALKELIIYQATHTPSLLDHFILPKCTEVVLGGFGETPREGWPVAQIHPSSIDHLPVTKGISKAVAMPSSCIFSGPNGNLKFWPSRRTREIFDARFFTSFSPISVLEIRELWVGPNSTSSRPFRRPWKQTAAGVHGAFRVLTKVEDLTIVSCGTEPFFSTLGATVEDSVLLPGLRRLTIYVGCGELDVPALIQCAKARKGHSRPLREVTVVFEEEPKVDLIQEVESLRESVEELIHRIGEAPKLRVVEGTWGR